MGRIEVNGLRFYSYHGCMEQETKIGGNYMVDVILDLNDTIDYCAVNKIVAREMAIPSKLIEHVGRRIVKAMRTELEGAVSVEVRVTKFSPPIEGDCESVAIVIKG
jgi:dihydroneopterin aldolase